MYPKLNKAKITNLAELLFAGLDVVWGELIRFKRQVGWVKFDARPIHVTKDFTQLFVQYFFGLPKIGLRFENSVS